MFCFVEVWSGMCGFFLVMGVNVFIFLLVRYLNWFLWEVELRFGGGRVGGV